MADLRVCGKCTKPRKRFVGIRCHACYQRERWASDPSYREKKRSARAAWYAKDPEGINAARRARQIDNTRESWLRRLRLLGLTEADYNRMLNEQGGVCAICGTKDTGHRRVFSVDHCHHTGKVRGLLCSACNSGLGHFADDPSRIEAALAYLRRP